MVTFGWQWTEIHSLTHPQSGNKIAGTFYLYFLVPSECQFVHNRRARKMVGNKNNNVKIKTKNQRHREWLRDPSQSTFSILCKPCRIVMCLYVRNYFDSYPTDGYSVFTCFSLFSRGACAPVVSTHRTNHFYFVKIISNWIVLCSMTVRSSQCIFQRFFVR